MKHELFSLRRLLYAIRYSLAGLAIALRDETAFTQEVCLIIVLIPLAIYAGASDTKTVLMLISLVIVLIVELLNSAIEATVDRCSTQVHPLAKRAKDLASAAVFLSIMLAVIIWIWGVWR